MPRESDCSIELHKLVYRYAQKQFILSIPCVPSNAESHEILRKGLLAHPAHRCNLERTGQRIRQSIIRDAFWTTRDIRSKLLPGFDVSVSIQTIRNRLHEVQLGVYVLATEAPLTA